jgi:hypothetical protein
MTAELLTGRHEEMLDGVSVRSLLCDWSSDRVLRLQAELLGK